MKGKQPRFAISKHTNSKNQTGLSTLNSSTVSEIIPLGKESEKIFFMTWGYLFINALLTYYQYLSGIAGVGPVPLDLQ